MSATENKESTSSDHTENESILEAAIPETEAFDNLSENLSALSNPEELWPTVVDIWQNGFMGVDIGQMIVALFIFFIFLVLRGLFTKYILNRLRKYADSSANMMDDKIIDALIPPIRLIPIILGLFFARQALTLNETLDYFYENTLRSLIIFSIFWGLSRALTPIQHLSRGLERLLSPMLVNWMFKVMSTAVILIGGAIILETWGIAVAPLLAGFGLLGAAVALGAQDVFKNLIAGITVIGEKRFQPGDWIKVDGVVEGTIEDIGFRSTRVRRFDKAPVHVPNAQLSDAAVTNFSRMTHRRIYWMVGVEYRTTTEQLKIIRDEILKYLNENDDFDKDVTMFVRVDSFGASSIDIMIYCFTKTTDWGTWLAVKEEFAFKLKEIIEETAGTSFAFPSQSVYIESMPEDRPEAFVPPSDKKAAA